MAPFDTTDDSLANSGTPEAILRQKFPGLFAGAPPPPTMDSGAPVVPAKQPVDTTAPDIGQSAAPAAPFVLPWMRQFQKQPQQPPISTPTGQWTPGTTKGQKLEVMLRNGLQGAIAGAGADAQAVVQSGGRRSGGFGLGAEAGFQAPAQQTQIQQSLQRGALENQNLQNQTQYAPALNFLKLLQGQAEVGKTQAETGKASAEAGKATAETGAIPTKTALESAQTEAANYKEDPNLGLIDLRTKQPVDPAGIAPLTAQEAQVLGKQPGERVPLKIKNTANEIVSRGLGTVAGENDSFIVNKGNGQTTPLHIGSPRAMFAPANRIIEVPDPDNPGQTHFITAGTALQSGAAGSKSASLAVPKQVLKWATTGKGGEEVNAFNTALQHADLLEQALTALGNGDVRTLNSIKNKFKTEFGSADMTNFQTIANAYTREITKMVAGGHMTNDEIATNGATLPANASNEQILGALQAYRSLAGSKMQMRYNQFQQGMQGKPNFPAGMGSGTPATGGHVIALGGKQYRYNGSGDTADLKNYAEIKTP
jgi:hypothetical protein